jgi:hypothetical protein
MYICVACCLPGVMYIYPCAYMGQGFGKDT